MKFDMPECGGCRTCELACSFRHTGAFSYAASSLRVLEKDDRHGYTLELLGVCQGERFACDGCVELDTAACVLHCREAERLEEIIQRFVRSLPRGNAELGRTETG